MDKKSEKKETVRGRLRKVTGTTLIEKKGSSRKNKKSTEDISPEDHRIITMGLVAIFGGR